MPEKSAPYRQLALDKSLWAESRGGKKLPSQSGRRIKTNILLRFFSAPY